ncbi:hypothetical protein [Nocardia kruczakiae]|uniref:hypothetical protein n=1 Tax=Nocardia kruczakiae TaxID=261477 RepID=UPI0007A4C8B5|nr:hypothetical protein [Nocardia kruczakiae]
MTLHITDWLMTSDVTPESAQRLPSLPGQWLLSWLPGELLTQEQALSGMILDEILSDPTFVDDLGAVEMATLHAAELGITLDEAVIRLCARVLERTALPSGDIGPDDIGPGDIEPGDIGPGDRGANATEYGPVRGHPHLPHVHRTPVSPHRPRYTDHDLSAAPS